ncbi:MAG: hypothetical protein RL322_3116 [Pseudomonadota bacterium]|jgi:hypothetical protein
MPSHRRARWHNRRSAVVQHLPGVLMEKETLAVVAFLVFCGFIIANWMNRPKK